MCKINILVKHDIYSVSFVKWQNHTIPNQWASSNDRVTPFKFSELHRMTRVTLFQIQWASSDDKVTLYQFSELRRLTRSRGISNDLRRMTRSQYFRINISNDLRRLTRISVSVDLRRLTWSQGFESKFNDLRRLTRITPFKSNDLRRMTRSHGIDSVGFVGWQSQEEVTFKTGY